MITTKSILTSEQLQVELQSYGLQMTNLHEGVTGRKGGAGPSDHKAIRVNGATIMVPVFNTLSSTSPYLASEPDARGISTLYKYGEAVSTISFPKEPKFYKFSTSDGVPMWKVAQLHSHNVLATTVLQNCTRYYDKATSCQFCAIGESLKAGRTIAYKLPHHLAEVAKMAVLADKVEQFIMTTGTPSTPDRGAKILHESVLAVKEAVNIPIQVQCEPPEDFKWFEILKAAGTDAIGMHLEAITPEVREKIMPGKAQVSIAHYMEAFKAAVKVFGRGNVSTYMLAGLGDTAEAIIEFSRRLIAMGVYPFIVPFVPINGTPLQDHPSPDGVFMKSVLEPVAGMLVKAGMSSETQKAGCAKCGACSTMRSFENKAKSII